MISRRGFLKGLLGGTLAGFFMGGYAVAEARLAVAGAELGGAAARDGGAASGCGSRWWRICTPPALAWMSGGWRRWSSWPMRKVRDLIALMGDYRATHRFQTRKVSIDGGGADFGGPARTAGGVCGDGQP